MKEPSTDKEIDRAIRSATRKWKLDAYRRELAWESDPDSRRKLLVMRIGIDVAKKLDPSTPINDGYWEKIEAAVL